MPANRLRLGIIAGMARSYGKKIDPDIRLCGREECR